MYLLTSLIGRCTDSLRVTVDSDCCFCLSSGNGCWFSCQGGQGWSAGIVFYTIINIYIGLLPYFSSLTQESLAYTWKDTFKVTKNEVGQKDGNGWVLVWHCGDRWLLITWTGSFVLEKISFLSLPFATAELICDYYHNRQYTANYFRERMNNWQYDWSILE